MGRLLPVLVLVLGLSWIIVVVAQIGLQVPINKDGSYSINVDGKAWLQSGATSLVINGTLFSSANGGLKLMSSLSHDGHCDRRGPFAATTLTWQATDSRGTRMVNTFTTYESGDTVMFEQSFPTGFNTGATDASSDTEVVTAFPSISSLVTDFNYLTYYSTFAVPHNGHWKNPLFPGGNTGGSPLVIYDRTLRALVLSPLTNFMVGVQTLSTANSGSLCMGITAKVQVIPAGFKHQSIIFLGQGINDALFNWGTILLNNNAVSKKRTALDADLILAKLGYWTDNGGAYWYNTEPGKNYQQTMLDVRAYLKTQNVPIDYIQFDSWWYPKDSSSWLSGGMIRWEPTPDIFPSGMSKWMDLPLILHNRWFSPDNDYVKSLNFSMIVEKTAALPTSSAVFEYLMGKAKAWGMQVYEQDWLVTTYTKMFATRNNVTNSAVWLNSMDQAATKLGLTVQYCMPLPSHVLFSTGLQTVTQIRASDDYRPGRIYPENWRIGLTSMLIWSVGAVPFKDDFWSGNVLVPGCKYETESGCIEPNSRMHAIISALSAGPIGPSDTIGTANAALIRETCTSDGTLLKPARPATPLDATFTTAFDTAATIDVWTTSSDLGSASKTIYLLALDLNNSFTVTYQDVELNRPAWVWVYNSSKTVDADSVMRFNPSNPLVIPRAPQPGRNAPRDYHYYVIAPVLTNQWSFLGEPNKIISVSPTRFSNLVVDNHVTASILGAPGEVVYLAAIGPGGWRSPEEQALAADGRGPVTFIHNFNCTLPPTGQATFRCGGDWCRCI